MRTSTVSALNALAPIAARNHGLVDVRRATEVGVDRRVLARLCKEGLLVRRYRGVYALASAPATWEQSALARQWACGPFAALSHLAAATLLGLQRLPTGRAPIDVTVPRGRYPATAGLSARTCDLFDPDEHTTRVGPFVVTTVLWTLVALSTEVGLIKLGRIYDAAIAAGRVTVEDLDDLLLRWWHHPGVVNARIAIGALMPEFAGTRSDAERRFLRILEAAGLPLPEANVSVSVDGRRFVLDFLYRDLGVWIEIDVHPEHGRTIGQRADGLRQNDIVALGLTPLRFDADDLFTRPDLVVRQVRRALEDAAQRS